MLILQGAQSHERDRTDDFADLARRRAEGVVLTDPRLLPEADRRLYVRRTLREDHQFRILNRPEGAQSKFDKLAGSLYDFFPRHRPALLPRLRRLGRSTCRSSSRSATYTPRTLA